MDERLSAELGKPLRAPTIVKEDNQSCIAMAKNPQYHGRAKHIDIKHHFVQELVGDDTIKLEYCPTNEMVADILTKGLARERFCYLRQKAGMESHEWGRVFICKVHSGLSLVLYIVRVIIIRTMIMLYVIL